MNFVTGSSAGGFSGLAMALANGIVKLKACSSALIRCSSRALERSLPLQNIFFGNGRDSEEVSHLPSFHIALETGYLPRNAAFNASVSMTAFR